MDNGKEQPAASAVRSTTLKDDVLHTWGAGIEELSNMWGFQLRCQKLQSSMLLTNRSMVPYHLVKLYNNILTFMGKKPIEYVSKDRG